MATFPSHTIAHDKLWTGYETRPMGGDNPYRCCTGCGRTDPEINGDINAHGENCSQVIRNLFELTGITFHARREEGEVQIDSKYEYMVPMSGRWVVCDQHGEYYANSRYRNDLREQFPNLEVIGG